MILNLLSDGDKNAKLRKSSAAGYATFGLSLAPHKISGFNVCPHASAGCISDCIFSAGNGSYPNVSKARIRRTKLYFSHRQEFLSELHVDLCKLRRDVLDLPVAVRLNMFSDIPWELIDETLFTRFPDFQYYDYTKNRGRYDAFLRGAFPENYHLTFSRSELNETHCVEYLRKRGTVAIPFRNGLPRSWRGFRVIDGDKTDLRFTDSPGCVVGLKVKGKGRSDKSSGFIVDAQDFRRSKRSA